MPRRPGGKGQQIHIPNTFTMGYTMKQLLSHPRVEVIYITKEDMNDRVMDRLGESLSDMYGEVIGNGKEYHMILQNDNRVRTRIFTMGRMTKIAQEEIKEMLDWHASQDSEASKLKLYKLCK